MWEPKESSTEKQTKYHMVTQPVNSCKAFVPIIQLEPNLKFISGQNKVKILSSDIWQKCCFAEIFS